MTLWRIKDGIPSLADCLLVSTGMIAGILAFIRVVDPFLNYFEHAGVLFMGYVVLLLIFGSAGALGFVTLQRNQKKLRPEFVGPRIAFAFGAPALFFVFRTLAIALLFPTIVRRDIPLERAFAYVDASLAVTVIFAYFGVVLAAFRWPARTTAFALWFVVGLGGLGLVTKMLALIFKR